MNRRHPILIGRLWGATLAATLGGAVATAQVPDAQPAAPAQAAPAGAAPTAASDSGSRRASASPATGQSSFLGKDLPFFDPGSETLQWDGRAWNLNNNRIFQARFEKYLNAPEADGEADRQYRAILERITDLLAPGRATAQNIDAAFQLLPQASNFEFDANLCDGLADAVYTVWLAKREDARLVQANKSLGDELKAHEWNAQMASSSVALGTAPKNGEAAKQWGKEVQTQRDMRMQPYVTRIAEVRGLMTANRAKREISELQTKLEFQALLVQLFTQRRFQHVIIGTRFYRAVFGDGDTKLQVKGDAKKILSDTTGMPPTLGVLDSLAQEAIRDSAEGVKAYDYLLSRNELESATKRLAEAFMVGEYLPPLRTLPRDRKRQALEFARRGNQLISALEVKDYTLAESIVKELAVIARDFDNSKPMAAVETARTVAAMHLAKAKNAAVSGDAATLEAELKEATSIWPRNPALADVSKLIFSQADVQQKALVDLDQLLSQRNYRQIFDDKVRFIAAAALYPDRQERLRKVLDDVQRIEASIIQAGEIAKRGDYAGAWETVEITFREFPDDTKLNQVRADFTIKAADFVSTLRKAEELEGKEQIGSSLAWYLKAQRIYPGSRFAREGVDRLVAKILPETQPTAARSAAVPAPSEL
jgi:hypothetical protein